MARLALRHNSDAIAQNSFICINVSQIILTARANVFEWLRDLTERKVAMIVSHRSLGELLDRLLGHKTIVLITLLHKAFLAECASHLDHLGLNYHSQSFVLLVERGYLPAFGPS